MNKSLLKWISCIAAVLAIIFFLIALNSFIEQQNSGEEYETIQSYETPDENVLDTHNAIISENTNTTDCSLEIRKIDFTTLQQRNSDVYAWIEVPGTNVDYPILQHESDNSYYLTHTIDHEKTVAASIYTENYNAKDFDDLHTVIYGHNMKNKTMFRTLHNFEDYEFFNENKDIIIYLPEETRFYQVFAAYTYDNRHLLFSYDWSDSSAHQKYIDDIFAINNYGANIDKNIELTGEDKIITLSTCVNSGDSTKRYLVQAVLVSIVK